MSQDAVPAHESCQQASEEVNVQDALRRLLELLAKKLAEDIAPFLSDASVTVAESGIHSRAEAVRMSAAGYDAVLVGEALVRSADPSSLIREMTG